MISEIKHDNTMNENQWTNKLESQVISDMPEIEVERIVDQIQTDIDSRFRSLEEKLIKQQ